MAKILIADTDLRVQKSIQDILSQRDGHHVDLASDKNTIDLPMGSKDKHLIFYANSFAAALELVKTSAFDMAFISVSFIDDKPDKWLQRIRSHSAPIKENAQLPISVFGKEETPDTLRKYMNAGIADYFAIPLDIPVFIQKFDLLLSGKVNSSDRQLYTFKTNQPIDLSFVTQLEEISEFGLSLVTNKPIAQNEFVILRGEHFGDPNLTGEVLARCYSVIPHPQNKGFFQVSLVFFGVNANQLKNIRRWLRSEYARKKQEAA